MGILNQHAKTTESKLWGQKLTFVRDWYKFTWNAWGFKVQPGIESHGRTNDEYGKRNSKRDPRGSWEHHNSDENAEQNRWYHNKKWAEKSGHIRFATLETLLVEVHQGDHDIKETRQYWCQMECACKGRGYQPTLDYVPTNVCKDDEIPLNHCQLQR